MIFWTEMIRDIVVAIVILLLAYIGGRVMKEILPKLVRRFGVAEEHLALFGSLSQYIIWIVGGAFFLTTLPYVLGIGNIGSFILSALHYVLLGCILITLLLLLQAVRGK